MGNSPSRETQRENGEEGKATNSIAPEASTNTTQQAESPTPGVKRKRRNSSKDEPRRKKRKSSSLPQDEPSNEQVAGSSGDESQAKDVAPHETPTVPIKVSNGKLTPISKKKKRQIMACVALPSRPTKDPDHGRPRRKPKSPAVAEAEERSSSGAVDVEEEILRDDKQLDLVCNVCGRQFANAKTLTRHMDNPGVHQKRHKCGQCEEAFYQPSDLKDHQKFSGHEKVARQSGNSTGLFTDKEKAKLTRFKSRFCIDYSVSEFDFNTLMTLLGRRDGSLWPNPDVTKAEFRIMFYHVLPDRTRKSLNRYRERYFQNVEQEAEWTEEQIKELRDLVNDKGHKWVEIAERMGRTQDSVYQKWKNRIRQGDAQKFDRWEEKEITALIVAVRECKVAAKLPQDFSSDDKVNWTAVSDRLGKTRNAQQCSSFWKRVYRPKEEAKARGESVKSLTPGRNKPAPVVSAKLSRRKNTRQGDAREVVTPRRKTFKSAMYISESDDDENSAPVLKARSDRVSKRSRSQKLSITLRDGGDSEQDADSTQGAEGIGEDQSDGDEVEVEGDEADSPMRKPQKNGLTDTRTSLPAALGHAPELQPNSSSHVSSTFQTVNSQAQKATNSHRCGKINPIWTDGLVSPWSPAGHETPGLPKLSKRTSPQVTSLTQVFNNTQAPTSARTAGLKTPGMHAAKEMPSPNIEMRLRPVQENSATSEDDGDDDENAAEQQETAIASGADFAIYESEADSTDGGLSREMFSSIAPRQGLDESAGVTSESDSDAQDLESDEDEPPQQFTSAPAQGGDEVDGAESDYEESDDEPPPQMFSSAIPEAQVGSGVAESNSEDSDDDSPPEMSTSVAALGEADGTPQTELDSKQEETSADDDDDDDDDDDEPPQMFTSALPDQDYYASVQANGDSASPHLPKNPQLNPPSETSSSGDAATIYPNGSADNSESSRRNNDDNDTTSDSNDSVDDSDNSMVEATQGDFFANLEASARKVREQRANVGRKVKKGREIGGSGKGGKERGEG